MVGEYNVRPKGGRKDNPEGPWLWCAYCQESNHWHGYVYTDAGEHHYLIGNVCARKHYGLDTFQRTRNSYVNIERLEGLRARWRKLTNARHDLHNELEMLLKSDAIRSVERKRLEIQKACPDALLRLAAAAMAGGSMTTLEPGRMSNGEQRAISVQLGRLAGSALIKSGIRSAITDLKSRFATAAEITDAEIEVMNAKQLTDQVRPLERACAAVIMERDAVAKAAQFFTPPNLRRVSRWAGPMRKFFVIEPTDDGGLLIWDRGRGDTKIDPLPRIKVPQAPLCRRLMDTSTA